MRNFSFVCNYILRKMFEERKKEENTLQFQINKVKIVYNMQFLLCLPVVLLHVIRV